MKIAATLLTLHLACAVTLHTAAAQSNQAKQGTGPKLTVRAKGKRLVVSERGRSRVLALGDKIDAARIEDATLLFVTRRPDFTYLLINVCGLSKARPDDRMCGAGVECNLVWVKLDRSWRVGDSGSARYESCWLPITSDGGYKIEGRVLRISYSDLHENKEFKLAYDADQPEKGFQIEESPIPDEPR